MLDPEAPGIFLAPVAELFWVVSVVSRVLETVIPVSH
jgi:hypothetical protein